MKLLPLMASLFIMSLPARSASPQWKIQVVIYNSTDFQYTDSSGQAHHVTAQMTVPEMNLAASAAKQFFETHVPVLDSGNMLPLEAITFASHPLTNLAADGTCTNGGYWPDPSVTSPDLDPKSFDSAMVVWKDNGVDSATGQTVNLGCYGGLTWNMGAAQAYSSFTLQSFSSDNQNVFKHEWGHGIVFYYDAAGTAPKPAVDNHINSTTNQYVHCGTGAPYVLVDETISNPIPNSTYNDQSGFTHDYYSGTTATPDQTSRCLGIAPGAWASGGPLAGRTPAPPNPDSPLLTGFSLNVPRNDYTGWAGMQFTVGAAPIVVERLGRLFLAGNNFNHVVKLVQTGNGADVPGGSAVVPYLGGVPGKFQYGALQVPITLSANTPYYLVSYEMTGDDQFYDLAPVNTTSAASVNGAVYSNGTAWVPVTGVGRSYIPVDLAYTAYKASTPPIVTITAPASGAVVSGSNVTVSATATAAGSLSIASVQFKVDGSNLGAAVTSPPYSVILDSTKLQDGSRNLTAVATDSAGNTATSATVKVLSGRPPSVGSATVYLNQDGTETIVTQFTGANRSQSLTDMFILFNATLSASNACWVGSDSANGLSLFNDAGTGLVPGSLSGGGTLQNSQCTLFGAGSGTGGGGGGFLTLTLHVKFANSFGNVQKIYGIALDNLGQNSGWVSLGITLPPVGTPPAVISAVPTADHSPGYTFTFSSANGRGYLNAAYALINTSLTVIRACAVLYYAPYNALYLFDDAGDALLPSALTPGIAGTLERSMHAERRRLFGERLRHYVDHGTQPDLQRVFFQQLTDDSVWLRIGQRRAE